MNREIKFRAWATKEKEMFPTLGIWEMLEMAGEASTFAKAKSELVLMQFTGLKDRSGKDIYEGDIVQDEYKVRSEVRIEEFSGGGYETGVSGIGFALNDTDMSKLEIIGNVYENPELLKV